MKDYVLTLLVAAAVTYVLTPLVRRLARRVGAMKQPRERDVHVVPIPTLGGLAMYGGLAAGLFVASQIPQLADAFAHTGMVSGLLLACGLLVVIGFIDDRWGMGALPKAAGQVAAAGILVATGTTLSWLPLPGGNTYLPTTDQATLLTVLIVVGTINAVNFIDGLDGLAAGIVCIAAISFFIYYYKLTNVISISALAAPALASAILIGICIGFLPHNFSPAKIFMGDTGAMLLGLLLAYAPISSIDQLPPGQLHQINRYPEIMPLLLPAALLVIPYGDLLLAVVRRTRAGRSPFAPDRKHLHHRLMDIGHSQRASVVIMYLWAAVFSASVLWLSIAKTTKPGAPGHHGQPIFVFIVITAAAVIALLLMSMPRLRWWQRPRPAAQPGAAAAASGLAGQAEPGAALAAEPGLVAVSSASNGRPDAVVAADSLVSGSPGVPARGLDSQGSAAADEPIPLRLGEQREQDPAGQEPPAGGQSSLWPGQQSKQPSRERGLNGQGPRAPGEQAQDEGTPGGPGAGPDARLRPGDANGLAGHRREQPRAGETLGAQRASRDARLPPRSQNGLPGLADPGSASPAPDSPDRRPDDPARTLSFWRQAEASPSPADGLREGNGWPRQLPPRAGRSVIGTVPPAVTSEPPLGPPARRERAGGPRPGADPSAPQQPGEAQRG